MNLVAIIGSIVNSVWGLFEGVDVPGTVFNFAEWFLGILLIKLSISVIQFGLGFSSGSAGYRSGSTNKPKISKERKGDTH